RVKGPDRVAPRTQPYDDGQRHRALRVADAKWHFRDKDIFPSDGQYLTGRRTGYGGLAEGASAVSAGNDAAAGDSVQCLQRASIATGTLRRWADRTAVKRLRT